jgi:DnaJ-class molecular chaperone
MSGNGWQKRNGRWTCMRKDWSVSKPSYTFEQMSNPEKHGLKICTHCNGYGSSLKEKADTCTVCGGSGLVPKEKEKQ